MNLLAYEQFAKLRLRDFADNPAEVADSAHWEWMGSRWFNEGIGFTSFSRHVTTPEDTGVSRFLFRSYPPQPISACSRLWGFRSSPG